MITVPVSVDSAVYVLIIALGGMDLYVREFGGTHHDDFYTDDKILNAFKNFTSQIVSRYVNSPAIFSWELANDAR